MSPLEHLHGPLHCLSPDTLRFDPPNEPTPQSHRRLRPRLRHHLRHSRNHPPTHPYVGILDEDGPVNRRGKDDNRGIIRGPMCDRCGEFTRNESTLG